MKQSKPFRFVLLASGLLFGFICCNNKTHAAAPRHQQKVTKIPAKSLLGNKGKFQLQEKKGIYQVPVSDKNTTVFPGKTDFHSYPHQMNATPDTICTEKPFIILYPAPYSTLAQKPSYYSFLFRYTLF